MKKKAVRMGRPHKDPLKCKGVCKSFRLTDEQFSKLQAKTKKIRVSDSAFIRGAIFYTIEQIKLDNINADEFYEDAMKL